MSNFQQNMPKLRALLPIEDFESWNQAKSKIESRLEKIEAAFVKDGRPGARFQLENFVLELEIAFLKDAARMLLANAHDGKK